SFGDGRFLTVVNWSIRGLAERVQVDKQSRIRIPERLLKLAGLTHEVVLIGVHDHVEIWDRAGWDAFLNQNGAQFDALTAEAFNLLPGGGLPQPPNVNGASVG
ncbi:MAG: division/cell wall cluster transcriptional repressor MraZ, partial [Planctomycetaceae bacterium]